LEAAAFKPPLSFWAPRFGICAQLSELLAMRIVGDALDSIAAAPLVALD
jgi:hypothetical protein